MITTGFSFIGFILVFAAGVFFVEEKTKSKFFEYVPPLVIIYFGAMLMSTLGLWQLKVLDPATNKMVASGAGMARGAIKSAILPSMVFLMLLRCDMRNILKLGPKMLLSFFCASASVVIGFIATFAMFKGALSGDPFAAKAFGALAGSWTGGTQNMVAVQQAVGLKDANFGYTLLIDSIDYSIWIMMLLYMVSSNALIKAFNKFNKADTSVVEEVSAKLQDMDKGLRKEVTFLDLFSVIALGFGGGAVFTAVSKLLPTNDFLTGTTWMILLATVAGILCAMTPLSKIPGTKQVSNVLLYTMVGLIASSANFGELTEAPTYILAGFVILAIHAVIMLIFAKIFKIDLFTCAVASCSNIGGVASAPVIAGAYNEALVPVGVLMGMMGVIIGTGVGITVAHLLQSMV